MNTTQTKLPKAIEEAFEKATLNIDDTSIIKEISCGSGYCSHDVIDEEKVKQFIAKALQTQTEEYRKRIEELNVYYQGDGDQPEIDYLKRSEVLNILKETK